MSCNDGKQRAFHAAPLPPHLAHPILTNPVAAPSVIVYVGPKHRRFVILTPFLNFPVFVAQLDQADEESGFQTTGGLVLPCEPSFFSEIIRFLDDDEKRFCCPSLYDFLADVSSDHLSCKESSSSFSFAPLLHKTRV